MAMIKIDTPIEGVVANIELINKFLPFTNELEIDNGTINGVIVIFADGSVSRRTNTSSVHGGTCCSMMFAEADFNFNLDNGPTSYFICDLEEEKEFVMHVLELCNKAKK